MVRDLSNVDNVKQATKEEFDRHLSAKNPHNITKADVGLSEVENYRPATVEEAKEARSKTTVMTPHATGELVSSVISDVEKIKRAPDFLARLPQHYTEEKVYRESITPVEGGFGTSTSGSIVVETAKTTIGGEAGSSYIYQVARESSTGKVWTRTGNVSANSWSNWEQGTSENHASVIATETELGHVKLGNWVESDRDGTIHFRLESGIIKGVEEAKANGDYAKEQGDKVAGKLSELEKSIKESKTNSAYAKEQGDFARTSGASANQVASDMRALEKQLRQAEQDIEDAIEATEQTLQEMLETKGKIEDLSGDMTMSIEEFVRLSAEITKLNRESKEATETAKEKISDMEGLSTEVKETLLSIVETEGLTKEALVKIEGALAETETATLAATEVAKLKPELDELLLTASKKVERAEELTERNAALAEEHSNNLVSIGERLDELSKLEDSLAQAELDVQETVEEARASSKKYKELLEKFAEIEEEVQISKEELDQTNSATELILERLNKEEDRLSEIKPVGAYSAVREYKKGNIVTFSGSTYMKLDNEPEKEANPPNLSSSWMVMAQRGLDGDGANFSVNSVRPDENGNIDLGILVKKDENGILEGELVAPGSGRPEEPSLRNIMFLEEGEALPAEAPDGTVLIYRERNEM